MLFLLITDKRGGFTVHQSCSVEWCERTREAHFFFLKCVWTPSANSLSHTFPWNIFQIKRDSRPDASLLCRCSWKFLSEVARKPQNRHIFHRFLTGNLQEQSERGQFFFVIKLLRLPPTHCISASSLLTQLKPKAGHTGHCLSIQHTRDQRLYYEGFFFIYLKWGGRNVLGT